MRMMRKREEDYFNGNLTAMIDVVFQLIIFFVATVHLQDDAIDARIKLAIAPHGRAAEEKNPLQVCIDVDNHGRISIGRAPLTSQMLYAVMVKIHNECKQDVPIVIRGDARAKHSDIRKAMDACTAAGNWRIKFSAVKEQGKS
jgi:biopolymer transport protein ExbD